MISVFVRVMLAAVTNKPPNLSGLTGTDYFLFSQESNMVALLGRSFTSGGETVAFSALCYGCTTPRISEYLLQTFKGESTTHLLFKSPGPGTSSSSAHISLIRSGHLTRPALKPWSTARVYFIHHQFHCIQGREYIFGV